ncbi:Sterol esterase 2 [Zalerion maritima]|uniref:Sterol esterase 2 n=1 Tax=Zalerion maritima TaxID=339359 RepID=A0AAD5RQ24_9PEZI|nr:Sterol esterase 2 [Zalerion maritima]
MVDTQHNTSSSTSLPQPKEIVDKASVTAVADELSQQAQKLSHRAATDNDPAPIAVQAKFITPQDPVIVESDGTRLPGVPLEEAHKLNVLREQWHIQKKANEERLDEDVKSKEVVTNAALNGGKQKLPSSLTQDEDGHVGRKLAPEGSLRRSMPPSHTHPLFPPLPLYGPPSIIRDLQCLTFRVFSFFLGANFLGVIVLGALFTSMPPLCGWLWKRLTFRNPDKRRPFYEEEQRRKRLRKQQVREWVKSQRGREQPMITDSEKDPFVDEDHFEPTEGGPDPIVCDVGYYARRVGLDVEEFTVQTEDGFVIDLWHVYDPKEYARLPETERRSKGPELWAMQDEAQLPKSSTGKRGKRFPVLLMHGLLQSAGAYCVNDDDSLAFYLCKSGYDVWLGNNRCGFSPKHTTLDYSDPRMWAWNIRQMGVFDLAALVSRVRYQTGFPKVGLICHSQGTTQTFVALAKEQRPDLGEMLTVFCALAPAAYAGPLIGKMYFKFMRVITPGMFRLMFGIHAFLPIMMTMHRLLNPRVYGWLGYKVFSFMFNWTDERWDRALKDRMFQFAPVYVSAESMRWWLGRECFARHKCILATKEEWKAEEMEDEDVNAATGGAGRSRAGSLVDGGQHHVHRRRPKGSTAWYDERAPPFAMWVAGSDDLVDGHKLLRRFERGREPHVRVVHHKVIPEYEHLDVLWAMDAPDQIFREVREVLWKTCDKRGICRVPRGCEDVELLVPEVKRSVTGASEDQTSSSGEEASV